MVCPPNGFKVDLHNQPLTMTTSPLSSADAFAHKTAHYLSRFSTAGNGNIRSTGFQVARSVSGKLDQGAASEKTGSMKTALWQTKNRGKPTLRATATNTNSHFRSNQ